jgi:hypothetical protein
MTIMWKIDDAIIVRRCLGMLTEVIGNNWLCNLLILLSAFTLVQFVLITGYMGLSRECDALISSLCRCVVSFLMSMSILTFNTISRMQYCRIRFLIGAATPLWRRGHKWLGPTPRTGAPSP